MGFWAKPVGTQYEHTTQTQPAWHWNMSQGYPEHVFVCVHNECRQTFSLFTKNADCRLTYTHIYTHTHVHTPTHTYIYIYAHMETHTDTHTNISLSLSIYIYKLPQWESSGKYLHIAIPSQHLRILHSISVILFLHCLQGESNCGWNSTKKKRIDWSVGSSSHQWSYHVIYIITLW